MQSPIPENEDLAALRDAIAGVLAGQCTSRALHDHIDGKIALDRSLWRSAVDLGWLGLGLPEEAGGLGMGTMGLDVLYRELGKRAAPGPFAASLSGAQTLLEVADAATRSEWLPKLAAGECSIAVAAQPAQTANGWLLGAEQAAAALVPLSDAEWGLVAMQDARPVAMWDRTRTILEFDPAKAERLATLPGAKTALALSRNLALAVAGDSIGGARAIVEQTIAYMKERQQFGRTIASFQALKHRIADLMTMVIAAEEMVALAVESAARGDPDAAIWADLAKVRASDVYTHAAADCLQLHGGVGFTWEFDVHLFLGRARLNEMLVAPGAVLRDRAAGGLADAVRAGRQPLELAL